MESIASAPGKVILFGEHAVVYNEPAIAGAVEKRARVRITEGDGDLSFLKSDTLDFEAELDTKKGIYHIKKGKPGIIRYIMESLSKAHNHSPINIELNMDIPIGSGLGSSAAVTVSTLAALYNFHGYEFNRNFIAKKSHEVELAVQGSASPLDTAVSTYGGMVYLTRNRNVKTFKSELVSTNASSFVIGHTFKYGNTGKMVRSVKLLKNRNPELVDPIIKLIGKITDDAKTAILNNDFEKIGELMNINHGLLDSIGVNTVELSRMVYLARIAGAKGSKITGAGGGGSIISFCPGRVNKVYRILNKYENAIKVNFAKEGVILE
ncbi:MAG: mevalonate kinase [Methanobacteriaceae archaeon]